MIVGLYWYQDLPEGLPDDQKFSARFVGAHLHICRFLVGFSSGLVSVKTLQKWYGTFLSKFGYKVFSFF